MSLRVLLGTLLWRNNVNSFRAISLNGPWEHSINLLTIKNMCTNVFYTCRLRDDLMYSLDPLFFLYENRDVTSFISKGFIGIPDPNALCDYCLYSTYVWLKLKKRFPREEYVQEQLKIFQKARFVECPYGMAEIETMRRQVKEVMVDPKKEQLHDYIVTVKEKECKK